MEPVARRRRTVVGPIILIGFGVLFLLLNFLPDFDPWPVLARYWPLFLIFLGLGKIWDYYRHKPSETAAASVPAAPAAAGTAPGPMTAPRPSGPTGVAVAFIILLVLLVAASWHARGRYEHRRFTGGTHSSQTVELQGAKSVAVSLEVPAGQLRLSGGSAHLLDAEFDYDSQLAKPDIDYSVSGDQGTLEVGQESHRHTHVMFGEPPNDWDLHFGNNIPLDLKLEMGAGQSQLSLRDLDVTNLHIEMGAGELDLDLAGPRKSSLTGTIEGGAGTATIVLPKDTGARVAASGGIGSIVAHGLAKDGDAYVNDSWGKTPTSIELTVEGGVGQINLLTAP
jgi:N-terminal domain of toast_rack, DUF2154/Domain of unknown function (DUF5668)